MYCTHCGNKLKENAQFCSACGTEVHAVRENSPAAETQQKSDSNSRGLMRGVKIPLPTLLVGAGVLILLGFLVFTPDSPQQNSRQAQSLSPQEQQLRSQIMTVARQFQCPCGECGDNLAACDCTSPDGAVEVKRFIRKGLQDGKTTDQMVTAVSLKYNVDTNTGS